MRGEGLGGAGLYNTTLEEGEMEDGEGGGGDAGDVLSRMLDSEDGLLWRGYS